VASVQQIPLLMQPDHTRPSQPIIPADRFQCIGPACEDSCCVGWSVYFDQATWNKYQLIPAGSLRTLIDENVIPLPPESATAGWHARVQMKPDNSCPFLNPANLCQIQAEQGAEYLSTTCATYPRIIHRIDGVAETSLSLSCPEAARLVLLNPPLSTVSSPSPALDSDATENQPPSGPVSLLPHFWEIRAFTLELLTSRNYALWQRLFLVGIFARRMDALARGELDRSFSVVLHDFRAAVSTGILRQSMDAIPPDLPLQLEMVLRLGSLQLPRSHIGQRFIETAQAFSRGLGHSPGATMATLLNGYAEAHKLYYQPLFEQHPHILENLLLNIVFRSLFPYGQKSGALNTGPTMAREFELMACQFALFKGLLIGVSGFYREAFSIDHVIRTIQSASKHFEHHPRFLDEAHALLASAQLDNVRGLTMLLRN
jgi:lysine-N-methylase